MTQLFPPSIVRCIINQPINPILLVNMLNDDKYNRGEKLLYINSKTVDNSVGNDVLYVIKHLELDGDWLIMDVQEARDYNVERFIEFFTNQKFITENRPDVDTLKKLKPVIDRFWVLMDGPNENYIEIQNFVRYLNYVFKYNYIMLDWSVYLLPLKTAPEAEVPFSRIEHFSCKIIELLNLNIGIPAANCFRYGKYNNMIIGNLSKYKSYYDSNRETFSNNLARYADATKMLCINNLDTVKDKLLDKLRTTPFIMGSVADDRHFRCFELEWQRMHYYLMCKKLPKNPLVYKWTDHLRYTHMLMKSGYLENTRAQNIYIKQIKTFFNDIPRYSRRTGTYHIKINMTLF